MKLSLDALIVLEAVSLGLLLLAILVIAWWLWARLRPRGPRQAPRSVLDLWAKVLNVTPLPDETDQELRERLLSVLRRRGGAP